jgi:hypothetical protein
VKTSFHIRIVDPRSLEGSSERAESGLTVWGPTKLPPDPSNYFTVEMEYDVPSSVVASFVTQFLERNGIRRIDLFDRTIEVNESKIAAVLNALSKTGGMFSRVP